MVLMSGLHMIMTIHACMMSGLHVMMTMHPCMMMMMMTDT